MKSFKNVPSASLMLLAVIVTVSNFALAKDPDAESCWRYTRGAHMQQGGSPEKDTCAGKQYCYVAQKAQDNEGKQGLSATRKELEGGCAGPNDPILSHPGINKDKTPSCSEQTHNGNDLVCVCSDDDCNKPDKLDDMLKKSKSKALGGGNGSQNLGYNLVLTVSALMTTLFFRV